MSADTRHVPRVVGQMSPSGALYPAAYGENKILIYTSVVSALAYRCVFASICMRVYIHTHRHTYTGVRGTPAGPCLWNRLPEGVKKCYVFRNL